ncbi:hypothetical protein [Pseudomonas lactis]|uniref:hypothetical protein n=1 Tax=Pseudomonas lactis TaxID=1615674 RepID=UPI00110C7888|nr:hypothetical protein [Pseudomonas lactis]
MSDETEKLSSDDLYKNMPKMLFSDAVRFFEQVTEGSACPACKASKWKIPNREDNPRLCFFRPAGLARASENQYNLEIECEICGFVRLHRASPIIRWTLTNASPELIAEFHKK